MPNLHENGNKLIQKTIIFIQNNKRLLLIACVILFALLVPGLQQYKENFDSKAWLPQSSPLIKDINQFELDFGNDLSFTIAVHSPDGIFDPDSLKILQELTESLWQIPDVVRVETLINYNYISAIADEISVSPFLDFQQELTREELVKILVEKKELALNHHMLSKFMVSEDGRSTMLLAHLAPSSTVQDNYDSSFNSITKLVEEYQGRGGHQLYLGGRGAIDPYFRKITQEDQAFGLSAILLFIIIYLLALFRSFLAVILPFVVTAGSTLMTMGICFYLGYEFNAILAILPFILLAIAIADSVHILTSYYQFRGKGNDNIQATIKTLDKNLLPTFITTITTMVGFFSLILSDFSAIAQLGLLGGIGCLLAWILSIFMMAPILFLCNLNIPKHFKNKKASSKRESQGSLWSKITDWLQQYRGWVLFIGITLGVFFTISSFKINIDNNPYKYFVEDFPLRVTQQFVNEHFESDSGPEIVIRSGKENGVKDLVFLSKVEQFKNWLNQQPYIFKTIDVIDIIKDMNQNFHGGKKEFFRLPENQKTVAEMLFLYTVSLPPGAELTNKVTINYESMRMSVFWNVFDTKGWLKHSELVLQKGRKLGLDLSISGEINMAHRMASRFVSTFAKSLGTALFLIAVMMALIFRSLKIGAIAMFVNVMPLIFGGGLMYLANINLGIGTILSGSICLGIAVDDTVHFLTNYFTLTKQGFSRKDAMTITLERVAPALIVTTTILAVGFGVNMLAQAVPNANFGFACFWILVMALAIDLILLPAILLKKPSKT